MKEDGRSDEDWVVVEEILSLLQEKRTSLKVIRTGVAIIVAQTSLLGFLITAPTRLAFIRTESWMVLWIALNLVVMGLAAYLCIGPLLHMSRLNRKIVRCKRRHRHLGCHAGR